MDFSLFKNLDKAFEQVTDKDYLKAALSVVDEFPDRKTGPDGPKVLVTTSGASKARQACQSWEQIDLEGRKPEWEHLVGQIRQLQQESEAVQGARPAEHWQQRAKDAEYKLFQICSLLLGAVDPLPYLESVAGLSARVLEVETQNRQLQSAAQSVAADTQEVQALVSKHTKLEAAHKELLEQMQRHEAEAAQVSVTTAEAAALREQLAAQAAELAKMQASLRVLRDEHERAQSSLFEQQSRAEQEVGSRVSEAEMAMAELERAQKRVAELEMERAVAGQRLAAATKKAAATQEGGDEPDGLAEPHSAPASRQAPGDSFWETQLRLKSEQLAATQAQLEASQRAVKDLTARSEAQLQTLRHQLTTAELNVERLTKELSKRPEVKEFMALQQRLDAVQLLVDVQMEQEGWASDQVKHHLKNLNATAVQSVLQERNRKLSSDVAALKREVNERDRQVFELRSTVTEVQADLAHKTALVRRLEDDLLQSSATHNAPLATSSSSNLQLMVGADSSSSLAGGSVSLPPPDGAQPAPSLLSTAPSMLPDDGGDMLAIVSSQRDRFRQRMTQLDEEKGALSDEVKALQRKLQEARTDNVSLYEKVRYLERYSQRQAASVGRTQVLKVDDAGVVPPQPSAKNNRYQCGPLALEFGQDQAELLGAQGAASSAVSTARGGVTVRSRGAGGRRVTAMCFPADEGGDEEAGYAKAYEARVNPFAEFQSSEVDSRVRALPAHDRAVLAGGRALLGSRAARVFIATYAALLHLFIFLLMYYAMAGPRRGGLVVVDLGAVPAAAGPATVAAAAAAAGKQG